MKRFCLMVFILVVLLLVRSGIAAQVVWNTFVIDDFSSWVEGGWILGAPLPYAPGVGFYGNGDVWAEGSFNVDGGGSYWVHAFLGDELSSFSDYLERDLLADVRYTGEDVISGKGVSGKQEYLAIIGYTSNTYDPSAEVETYYGWVKLDGKAIIASALTADGPLRIGTGELIPEPTAGVLFILGAAVLGLRRRRNRGVNSPLFAKSGE